MFWFCILRLELELLMIYRASQSFLCCWWLLLCILKHLHCLNKEKPVSSAKVGILWYCFYWPTCWLWLYWNYRELLSCDRLLAIFSLVRSICCQLDVIGHHMLWLSCLKLLSWNLCFIRSFLDLSNSQKEAVVNLPGKDDHLQAKNQIFLKLTR